MKRIPDGVTAPNSDSLCEVVQRRGESGRICERLHFAHSAHFLGPSIRHPDLETVSGWYSRLVHYGLLVFQRYLHHLLQLVDRRTNTLVMEYRDEPFKMLTTLCSSDCHQRNHHRSVCESNTALPAKNRF